MATVASTGLQSSARSDAGETARTIGALLNWMAEQQEVFVFATANDVRQLAPEQIRQGRFSQVVFVDLPTPEDRADIFRVHLSKRGRDPEAFDLEELAQAAEGFSGAEVEAAVKGALLPRAKPLHGLDAASSSTGCSRSGRAGRRTRGVGR